MKSDKQEVSVDELKEWTMILPREIRDDVDARLAENAALKAEVEELRRDLEQTRVQLAGCGVAAMGGVKEDCKPGEYGYSASLSDVVNLYRKYEAAESRLARYEGVIKAVEDCPIEDLESCIEVNGQDLNPDPALDIIRAALRVRETKAKE